MAYATDLKVYPDYSYEFSLETSAFAERLIKRVLYFNITLCTHTYLQYNKISNGQLVKNKKKYLHHVEQFTVRCHCAWRGDRAV